MHKKNLTQSMKTGINLPKKNLWAVWGQILQKLLVQAWLQGPKAPSSGATKKVAKKLKFSRKEAGKKEKKREEREKNGKK